MQMINFRCEWSRILSPVGHRITVLIKHCGANWGTIVELRSRFAFENQAAMQGSIVSRDDAIPVRTGPTVLYCEYLMFSLVYIVSVTHESNIRTKDEYIPGFRILIFITLWIMLCMTLPLLRDNAGCPMGEGRHPSKSSRMYTSSLKCLLLKINKKLKTLLTPS